MKITQNFIADLQRLKVELSIVLRQASWRRERQLGKKIPKLAGFQKFLRIYLSMSPEQQIVFAPELKRRMIRQQIVFGWVHLNNAYVNKLFTNSFRRMNDIPGDRSVHLTSNFSCIGCH